MTLKELFCAVNFDEILPIIIEYDPQILGSEIALKQAFDSIKLISPCEESNGVITVSYFNDIDSSEGFCVRNCSNDRFEEIAGRKIESAPNLELSLNELAAYCLWELTYWGFSDEEVVESFRNKNPGLATCPKNSYEQEYIEKSKRWFPPIPLSSGTIFQEKSQNRSKRKREYRRERRLKQLIRYAKIEDLCHYLKANNVEGLACDDLWALKNVAGFIVTTDRSYSKDASLAEHYMCELYKKYANISQDIVRSIVIITGGNAVTDEFDALKQTLKKLLPNALIGIGKRQKSQIVVTIINVLP